MTFSENQKVEEFLADILLVSAEKSETIESIRKIFLNSNQNFTEDIKYGGLIFNLKNILVGGIFTYNKHISIEFSDGFEFSDPSDILEGNGKKRRHIKIFEKQDVKDKNVSFFVKQASAME